MDKEALKSLCKSLKEEEENLWIEIKKRKAAIEALQKMCEHDWDCVGHDSHKDHYVCKICGDKDYW